MSVVVSVADRQCEPYQQRHSYCTDGLADGRRSCIVLREPRTLTIHSVQIYVLAIKRQSRAHVSFFLVRVFIILAFYRVQFLILISSFECVSVQLYEYVLSKSFHEQFVRLFFVAESLACLGCVSLRAFHVFLFVWFHERRVRRIEPFNSLLSEQVKCAIRKDGERNRGFKRFVIIQKRLHRVLSDKNDGGDNSNSLQRIKQVDNPP